MDGFFNITTQKNSKSFSSCSFINQIIMTWRWKVSYFMQAHRIVPSLSLQWQLIKSEKEKDGGNNYSFTIYLFLKNFWCRLFFKRLYIFTPFFPLVGTLDLVRIQILLLPFISYMIWDTLFNLCEPQFHYP